MKSRLFLGIFAIFALIGSAAFGAFSENSRQGSEPIFSISGQGVEVLNPGTDPGSEGTGSENRARLNNYAKVLTPYLYTGRRLDTFTGNYNNRNRYYSPKYGRFTSQDPIGFNGGNNLWSYANQNPLRYTDPHGKVIFEFLYGIWLEIWKTQSERTIQRESIARLLRQVQDWIRNIEGRDPCDPELEKLRGLEREIQNALGSLREFGSPDLRKMNDGEIRRNGIEPHDLKEEYLGKGSKISHYDLYVDKKTGDVYIARKGGQGKTIKTHVNVE